MLFHMLSLLRRACSQGSFFVLSNYTVKDRNVSAGDQHNRHCANSFGKGLKNGHSFK